MEKQVLTTYTNFIRYCFPGTTPVLAPNVWANEIPELTPAPGNQTWDLMIASPMFYLMTIDTTFDLLFSSVFNMGKSNILTSGKELTLYQMRKF